MSSKPRLDRLRALAEANLQVQQFGQKEDNEVHEGKTACTHAICQFLSLAWNGTLPTLNQVNRMAGMPKNAVDEVTGKPRGMRPNELAAFLKAARIPMDIRRGLAFKDVLKAADSGPVFYGMRYGSAPKKTSSHPHGTTQSGIPDTRHAVVMLGHLSVGGSVEVYRKEPNHGSPNRPERPPYDTISDRQARIEYEEYKSKLGQKLYAALPTRELQVIGTFSLPALPPPPPLVLTNLVAFSGEATVRGDGHFAVQIADRQFIALANGASKRVVAIGKLRPRLPGPPGDRTNVVLVGDEAAILLRADITLRTDSGMVIEPPPTEASELVPIGPEIPIPPGVPTDDAADNIGNDFVPP